MKKSLKEILLDYATECCVEKFWVTKMEEQLSDLMLFPDNVLGDIARFSVWELDLSIVDNIKRDLNRKHPIGVKPVD